jgi:hypothetical protein
MRRLALVATSLLISAGLAASVPAGDRAATVGPVACGTAKQFTYLFWPQGHPAIPSVNFPAFPIPHLELYKGSDATFPNAATAAVVNAQTGGGFARSCKAAKQGRAAPIQKPRTTTQTGALTCTFPRAPLQTILKAAGGFVLLTVEPAKPGTTGKPQVEVSVTIKATGSTLAFDAKVCKLGAAPKPPPLMQFSFQGLMDTFLIGGSAPFTEVYSGTSCGSDILRNWKITITLNGNAHASSVDFAASNLATVTTLSGVGTNSESKLQLSPGPPATMTLTVTQSGNLTGLSINPSQVPITATPVASC